MARKQASEKPFVVSSAAAAVPARRKPTTPKRTLPPTTAVDAPVVAAQVLPATIAAPPSEQIAALAYSYWEGRGYQGGSPEEDWLHAEQQLSALSAK